MTRLRAPQSTPGMDQAGDPAADDEAKDLEALRLKVWRSRRRRVRLMGRVYLVTGLIALVAGYATQYFGLEALSAAMIPLGAFFTLAGNEPYVKSSLAGKSVISAMRVLQETLKVNSDQGHAVFVPSKEDRKVVDMFIPAFDLPEGAASVEGVEGHHYTPLGHELFGAYLREAGGKTEHDPLHALEQLRTIMTAGLELVEDVKFEFKAPVVDISIKNATFAEIGNFPDLAKGVYAKAGCPVTNSIAEWVSYCTGATVRWVDAQVNPRDRSATVKLILAGGPG
ncbi:MAG TPA: hypothetical protein VKF15_05990 [Nitrososphaerales archaeon]|nr:hypothetical protein [Nitrososphaerales archaeon]